MTNHNSIQNTPNAGVNHTIQTVLNAHQHEKISCLEPIINSNEILQEIVYLMRMMNGYHQFIGNCFLVHPDLEDLTLSVEAIQLDIDKRLNSILQLAISN